MRTWERGGDGPRKFMLKYPHGKTHHSMDIKVNTQGRLTSSTADLMLDSTFESAQALKDYSKHPEHVAVADSKVRPFTAGRACLDFEV